MSLDPNAQLPEEQVERCDECGGDGFVWTRPGFLGTPFHEVTCSACGGSGMAHKDDNKKRRKKRQEKR